MPINSPGLTSLIHSRRDNVSSVDFSPLNNQSELLNPNERIKDDLGFLSPLTEEERNEEFALPNSIDDLQTRVKFRPKTTRQLHEEISSPFNKLRDNEYGARAARILLESKTQPEYFQDLTEPALRLAEIEDDSSFPLITKAWKSGGNRKILSEIGTEAFISGNLSAGNLALVASLTGKISRDSEGNDTYPEQVAAATVTSARILGELALETLTAIGIGFAGGSGIGAAAGLASKIPRFYNLGQKAFKFVNAPGGAGVGRAAVAGGFAGGVAGAKVGFAWNTFALTLGSNTLEFMRIADTNGQPLPRSVLMGGVVLTSALETGLELWGLRSIFGGLTNVPKMTKGMDKSWIFSAIKRNEKARKLLERVGEYAADYVEKHPNFSSGLLTVARGGGVEAITEGLQAIVNTLGQETSKLVAEILTGADFNSFASESLVDGFEDAKYGSSIGFGVGTLFSTPNVLTRLAVDEGVIFFRRKAQKELAENMVDAISGSKATKEAAKLYREADNSAKISHVSINPGVLLEIGRTDETTAAQLATLGERVEELSVANLEDAMSRAKSIRMPLEEFAEKVGDSYYGKDGLRDFLSPAFFIDEQTPMDLAGVNKKVKKMELSAKEARNVLNKIQVGLPELDPEGVPYSDERERKAVLNATEKIMDALSARSRLGNVVLSINDSAAGRPALEAEEYKASALKGLSETVGEIIKELPKEIYKLMTRKKIRGEKNLRISAAAIRQVAEDLVTALDQPLANIMPTEGLARGAIKKLLSKKDGRNKLSRHELSKYLTFSELKNLPRSVFSEADFEAVRKARSGHLSDGYSFEESYTPAQDVVSLSELENEWFGLPPEVKRNNLGVLMGNAIKAIAKTPVSAEAIVLKGQNTIKGEKIAPSSAYDFVRDYALSRQPVVRFLRFFDAIPASQRVIDTSKLTYAEYYSTGRMLAIEDFVNKGGAEAETLLRELSPEIKKRIFTDVPIRNPEVIKDNSDILEPQFIPSDIIASIFGFKSVKEMAAELNNSLDKSGNINMQSLKEKTKWIVKDVEPFDKVPEDVLNNIYDKTLRKINSLPLVKNLYMDENVVGGLKLRQRNVRAKAEVEQMQVSEITNPNTVKNYTASIEQSQTKIDEMKAAGKSDSNVIKFHSGIVAYGIAMRTAVEAAQERIEGINESFINYVDKEGVTRGNILPDYLSKARLLMITHFLPNIQEKYRRLFINAFWFSNESGEGLASQSSRGLVDEFNTLFKDTSSTNKALIDFKQWANRKRSEGDPFKESVFGSGFFNPGMDMAQFDSAVNLIRTVIHAGRVGRETSLSGKKQRMEYVEQTLANHILTNVNTVRARSHKRPGPVLSFISTWHDYLLRIETLVRELDGFKDNEMAWNLLFNSIRTAYDNFVAAEKAAAAFFVDVFKKHYSKQEMNDLYLKNLKGPDGLPMTREELIAIGLNSGNNVNMLALIEQRDFPWTEESIRKSLDQLTTKDAQFIQEIWDYFGSFWPEIKRSVRQRAGVEAVEVQSRPISIGGIELKGGYYPLRYVRPDGKNSYENLAHEEILGRLRGGEYSSVQTQEGHRQSRSATAQYAVLLDLNIAYSHARQVLYDLVMGDVLVDTFKLLNGEKVKEAMIEIGWENRLDDMNGWLEQVATNVISQGDAINRFWEKAKSNVSLAAMGYRVTTVLKQVSGFTQSLDVLGAKDLGKGLYYMYWTSPQEMYDRRQDILKKSPFMAARMHGFHREIVDAMSQLKPFGSRDLIQKNAYVMIGVMQSMVDFPTWYGSYTKFRREEKTEQESIDLADSYVRRSQSSGQLPDISKIERSEQVLWRLFTMFYTYFNAKYNLTYERYQKMDKRKFSEWLGLLGHAFLLYAADPLVAEVMVGRIPNYKTAEEDEVEDWVTQQVLQTFGGTMPIIREIIGNFYYPHSASAPGLSFVPEFSRAIRATQRLEFSPDLVRSYLNLLGLARGLPSSQANVTVAAAFKEEKGERPAIHEYFLYPERD